MFSSKRMAIAVLTLVLVALAMNLPAQVVKGSKHNLDDIKMSNSRLWVGQNVVPMNQMRAESIQDRALGTLSQEFDRFLADHGTGWDLMVDGRTGRASLVSGQGLPWVPGNGNTLRAESFGPQQENDPAVRRIVLDKAADFMRTYPELFGVSPEDFVVNEQGTGEFGGYLWYVHLMRQYQGIPVEKSYVVFRVNHGNLVQFGGEFLSPINVDATPSLSLETAKQILDGYVGGFQADDEFINPGTLSILPLAPQGDTGIYAGAMGQGVDFHLVYTIAFHRPDVLGNWEAKIDAHTGEVLRFIDSNKYGSVTGGIYKVANNETSETIMPMPFAGVGTSTYANAAGVYSATSGSVTGSFTGKYIKVTDSCGTSSLTVTAPANIAWGTSSATDCSTGSGGGGAGNTRAARSTYYHMTTWKEKAMAWLPSNTWLTGQLQDKVNLSQTCNAYWAGSYVAFFKSGGGCSNTGELPTVFLHEIGHGLDDNDGSASSSVGSSEAYGDLSGVLATHDSCLGKNFIPGQNCSGYGNACTSCTGIRDADYTKHSSATPAKPSNLSGTSGFHCSLDSSYPGPCGYEGHCESYIMSEVGWDLAASATYGLRAQVDTNTAWFIADRLFWLTRPTAAESYTCASVTTANGCGTSNWYQCYLVADDDNGNLTDGTPHANSIYLAFNNHAIACTTGSHANSTTCTISQTAPTLTATGASGAVNLSWTAVTGATSYTVLRNEMSATSGMMIIAKGVTATTYSDTLVASGITYYYSVVGNTGTVTSAGSCLGTLAAVASATPATGTTYSISGTVSGATASGVTITLSGAATGSTTTATDGTYTLSGLANGTYTVTPSKTGYTFSPTSTSVTIASASQTGKNFTATANATYSISGTITGATSVTVACTGQTSVTTSSTYTFSGLANGTYTVTPNKSGYTFSPASYSVTISGANATGKDFTATAATTYSISGTITGATSVTVACTGQTSVTTSSTYTFSGLANGTYTVTPSKSGYTFTPASYSVTIASANVTGKDFTATAVSGDYALTSGVGVSGTVAASAYNYYTIAVPSGATSLAITLTNLTADVDLYCNNSSTHPTTSTYTGRSWNSGTTSESLSYTSPVSGTWSIAAYGYAAGSYTVTATVVAGGTTYYSIAGTITASSVGLSGVTVTAGTASATTASDGTYTISGLVNGTYTVTPSKTGYTFSPTSTSVTISGANQTGKNFTGTASGGTTTQILLNPGFESGANGNWTISTSTSHTVMTTVSTPQAAHGGSYQAQLGYYNGTYYQSETDSIRQTVTIPSGATAATLSFWYNIRTTETTTSTAYDKLTVTVENTSGTVLATLTTLSNLNKTTTWTQKTGLSLLSYKGQTVVIRIKATTDSSLGTYFGVDDAALSVTQ